MNHKKLGTFAMICVALMAVLFVITGFMGIKTEAEMPMLVSLLFTWTPAIAVIATKLIFKEAVVFLGKDANMKLYPNLKGNIKYYVQALLMPLLLGGIGTGIYYFVNPCDFSFSQVTEDGFLIPYTITYVLTQAFLMLYVAIGQEWGWRFFLTSELLKGMTRGKASFVTGIVWAVWQYPFYIFLGRDEDSVCSPYGAILLCTITAICMSSWYTYLFEKTESVLAPTFLHAAYEASLFAFFYLFQAEETAGILAYDKLAVYGVHLLPYLCLGLYYYTVLYKMDHPQGKMVVIYRKMLAGCLAVVLIVTGMGTGIYLYANKKMEQVEADMEAAGLANLVDVGGYQVNVRILGDENAAHTIVYIAGSGMSDSEVVLEPLAAQLKDAKIVVIDRAGMGLSDDVCDGNYENVSPEWKDRTAKTVVAEYRNALEAVNVEGPYILMAHSMGYLYAQTWQQEYLQEIEGVVYLDCMTAEYYVGEEDYFADMKQGAMKYLKAMGQLGAHWVSYETAQYIGFADYGRFTPEEMERRYALTMYSLNSVTQCEENSHVVETAKELLSGNMENNIPKVAIFADSYSGSYFEEYIKEEYLEAFDGDQEAFNAAYEEQYRIFNQELEQDKAIYEGYGNMTILTVSGPHDIYAYAPEKVAEAVELLLDKLQ